MWFGQELLPPNKEPPSLEGTRYAGKDSGVRLYSATLCWHDLEEGTLVESEFPGP